MFRDNSIWNFAPSHWNPDVPSKDYAAIHQHHPTAPIVIDHGSFQVRVGWAHEQDPRYVFRNLVLRHKPVKNEEFRISVGNTIPESEMFKSVVRCPFERDVVYHFDSVEHVLDHSLSLLNLSSSSVEHPFFLTECLANPNFCRGGVSEIVFEAYGAPALSYGLDGILALYKFETEQGRNIRHGLVIYSGSACTSIIPIVHGKSDLTRARRLAVAGSQATEWMWRVCSARNPNMRSSISIPIAEKMKESLGYTVPGDFLQHVSELEAAVASSDYDETQPWLSKSVTVQLPYFSKASDTLDAEDAARRTAELLAKREALRQKSAERFREMAKQKRSKKIAELEAKLETIEDEDEVEVLRKEISELKDRLNAPLTKEGPAEGSDEWLRQNDPETFLQRAMKERDEIVERQAKRAKLRADIAKRHSEVNRRRLMLIADAAGSVEDFKNDSSSKARKRKAKAVKIAAAAAAKKKKSAQKKAVSKPKKKAKREDDEEEEEVDEDGEEVDEEYGNIEPEEDLDELGSDDNFGENDEDWMVYHEMARDLSSDEEEADSQRLKQLQKDIETLDATQRHPVVSEAEWHRIVLGTERPTVGELVFSPASVLGIDSAGLIQCIVQYILPHYGPGIRKQMLENVFVCGGNSKFPGFAERIAMDLQSYVPEDDKVVVRRAKDAQLDAWRGAAAACRSEDPERSVRWISRKMYDECGKHYLVEHAFSNLYFDSFQPPEMT
eukprot:ANDGO_01077.mRNA.1 Actin-related protein 5